MVVGEVLLRGGEAGSVVPTKVPGNLERRVGALLSSQEPHPVPHTPRTLAGPTAQVRRPRTYMAPWELAA